MLQSPWSNQSESIGVCRRMHEAVMRTIIPTLLLVVFASPALAQSGARYSSTAPRLVGNSMLYKIENNINGSETLYFFGGMVAGQTAPSSDLYAFDVNELTWAMQEPSGEDKPLGRMWQSAAESNDGSQILVYGGINCYEPVTMATTDANGMGSRIYHFSTLGIEYQDAMEDIWAVDFAQWIWIEVKPARTRRRGICDAAENTEAIENWVLFDYMYDDTTFSKYPGVLAFVGVLGGTGYLVIWLLNRYAVGGLLAYSG